MKSAKCAERLKNGTAVYISKSDPVSVDSLLLASFASALAKKRTLELGCGNASMLLWLADRGLLGSACAIELRAEAAALASRSFHECGIEASVLIGDIREHRESAKYDLVISNPPYFSGGKQPEGARADMKFEKNGSFSDFCAAAARNLKQRGSFCFCYPASRLVQAFECLKKKALEPKRLRLVYHTAGREPYLLLCDARLSAGQGLSIAPPLVITTDTGEYTSEYADITAEYHPKDA